MKKALVVFLILAVAGGLFAQLSFSGAVQGGLGVRWTGDDGDNLPEINFVRNRGETGFRGQLTVKLDGETDNFGKYHGETTFRANQGLWDSFSAGLGDTYFTWQPSSLLKIRIGNSGNYGFGSPTGLFNLLQTWQGGLNVNLYPVSGLEIGYGAFIGPNGKKPLDKLTHGFGVKYGVPIVDINASAQIKTEPDTADVDVGVGAKLKVIPGLPIGVDVGAYNLLDSDANFIGAGLKVEYTGIAALTLNATGYLFYPLASALPTGFMPMLVHAGVGYKVSDVTSFGVEGRYLIGRGPGDNWREAGELGAFGDDGGDVDFAAKDKKAFGLSPSVTFNVGPEVKIGYNLRMDLSDGAAASANRNMVYVQFHKSF